MKSGSKLIDPFFLSLPVLSLFSVVFIRNVNPIIVSYQQTCSRVILFSWDGVQYNHLKELYDSGRLGNLRALVQEAGPPIIRGLITDHYTETNYGHPSLLSGVGQGKVQGCPDNITVWENIKAWNNSWVTGLIAGKAKFSSAIFPQAKDSVDYWFAEDTTAKVVTDLAISFVNNYSASSFFLFVHYREPDYAGHDFGENSLQYEEAIIECDNQVGRILSTLETDGAREATAILVTTDHGFVENGFMHSSPAWGAPEANPDCYIVWIACNRGFVDLDEAANEYWDQNDVAPTIYSLIGINDYAIRWAYIRGTALWERKFDLRDVSITNVQLSADSTANKTFAIDVLVTNQGDYTEIPTISIYYANNVIEARTLAYPYTPLYGRERNASAQKITFIWHTDDVPSGNYTISVRADVVPATRTSQPNMVYTKNETKIWDNTLTDGSILIQGPSTDLNADGFVNIIDITIVAKAFGSNSGDPNWDEKADLDKNGTVNIMDITAVARDYGRNV